MARVDEFADFHPLSRGEWRAWLAENYDKSEGVWFVYFKKASGKPRVSYDEAVEEALCFGWIDSLPRKVDETRSKLLFTPRKKKASGRSRIKNASSDYRKRRDDRSRSGENRSGEKRRLVERA